IFANKPVADSAVLVVIGMLEFVSRTLDPIEILYQGRHRGVDTDAAMAWRGLYLQVEDGNAAGCRQLSPHITVLFGNNHRDQDAVIARDLEQRGAGMVPQFPDKGIEGGIARGLNQHAVYPIRVRDFADHLEAVDPPQLGR